MNSVLYTIFEFIGEAPGAMIVGVCLIPCIIGAVWIDYCENKKKKQ